MDFGWLVPLIRAGPPVGFFRIGWVRAMANLNEFFLVRRGGRFLSRRLQACGLEVEWAGTSFCVWWRSTLAAELCCQV